MSYSMPIWMFSKRFAFFKFMINRRQQDHLENFWCLCSSNEMSWLTAIGSPSSCLRPQLYKSLWFNTMSIPTPVFPMTGIIRNQKRRGRKWLVGLKLHEILCCFLKSLAPSEGNTLGGSWGHGSPLAVSPLCLNCVWKIYIAMLLFQVIGFICLLYNGKK